MMFSKNPLWLGLEDFTSLDHFRRSQPAPEILGPTDEPSPDPKPEGLDLPPSHQELKAQSESQERERLVKTLERTNWHRAAAAAILGLSPQLLNSKLKKYGLTAPAAPDGDSDGEKERLREALEKTGGSKSRAAELLGISRQLLYRRLKQYGLSVEKA